MTHLVNKSALVAEIERRIEKCDIFYTIASNNNAKNAMEEIKKEKQHYKSIVDFLDTLEVKELAPMAYVVTRCEEHSDYVEEVFFNEDKAQEYCEQFKEKENEYARHITKVKVTL